MEIIELLSDKNLSSTEKRKQLVLALTSEELTVATMPQLNDKQAGIVLEAMEEISRKESAIIDENWLNFAGNYVISENNTLKRESARVIGNIAHLFPDKLENIIPKLFQNAKNESTVVRWSSAYSLGRIIQIPAFAKSNLFDKLSKITDEEQNNGVKNQYLISLKKALKIIKVSNLSLKN